MSNIILVILNIIILFEYAFERILSFLNLKNWSNTLPAELKDFYDEEKYQKSQAYSKANQKLSLITSSFSTIVILLMINFNGFAKVDLWANSQSQNPILVALLFFGVLLLASDIINIPFSLYSTFVIEEKFGFNKMNLKTFIFDKLKGYLLAGLFGGLLLSAVVFIYLKTGTIFWILVWLVLTLFTLFITTFYTTLIVPIFNKLKPLEKGALRTAIEKYSNEVGFSLKNIFVIDGSKRSSKANAYFSGLGSKKSIVLFDTLINEQSTEELVSVLAHEVGHYKRKHTLKNMLLSILQTGIMLYIFSLVINNPALPEAIGIQKISFHISLLIFGLLYSPISLITGILMNLLSRKYEYEADHFASTSYSGKHLASALKKLSINHLSNLKPHPASVFVHYSHPPLLQRLHAISKTIK